MQFFAELFCIHHVGKKFNSPITKIENKTNFLVKKIPKTDFFPISVYFSGKVTVKNVVEYEIRNKIIPVKIPNFLIAFELYLSEKLSKINFFT